jgi:hypothetical protein
MTRMQIIHHFRNELLVMHPEDIRLVLSILLPEEADIEMSVEEIEKWKQENQDTMKK